MKSRELLQVRELSEEILVSSAIVKEEFVDALKANVKNITIALEPVAGKEADIANKYKAKEIEMNDEIKGFYGLVDGKWVIKNEDDRETVQGISETYRNELEAIQAEYGELFEKDINLELVKVSKDDFPKELPAKTFEIKRFIVK